SSAADATRISSSASVSGGSEPVSFSRSEAKLFSMSFQLFPSFLHSSCRIHTISEIVSHSRRLKGLNAAPSMHNSSSSSDVIPRAAVSGAIFRGGQVLLVQRGRAPAKGLWSLPGGHIETGETAAEALVRELMEETGITARLDGVVDAVNVIKRDDDGAVIFHR